MRPYAEALIRLFYPAGCGLCAALLCIDEKGLCHACLGGLSDIRYEPLEAVLPQSGEDSDQTWCLYPYSSPVREILTAVKFGRKKWLLQAFESRIKGTVQALLSERVYDAIVPIPLEPGRLIEREFNQSEVFSNLLSGMTGLPTVPLLRKREGVPAQSSLRRKERLANLIGAFRLSGHQDIRNKNFLIVDDILTTGATTNEAARILKKHGAGRVDVLALARAEAEVL